MSDHAFFSPSATASCCRPACNPCPRIGMIGAHQALRHAARPLFQREASGGMPEHGERRCHRAQTAPEQRRQSHCPSNAKTAPTRTRTRPRRVVTCRRHAMWNNPSIQIISNLGLIPRTSAQMRARNPSSRPHHCRRQIEYPRSTCLSASAIWNTSRKGGYQSSRVTCPSALAILASQGPITANGKGPTDLSGGVRNVRKRPTAPHRLSADKAS